MFGIVSGYILEIHGLFHNVTVHNFRYKSSDEKEDINRSTIPLRGASTTNTGQTLIYFTNKCFSISRYHA